jgi:SpoVK/Ycf46/Vps4 family AAA+-type ATPase
MMRVVIVMGEPGTGKTTLVRKVMDLMSLTNWKEMFTQVKLVPFHVFGNYVVLGKYEAGEVFAGTDRMSMAVQPEAVKFLKECKSRGVRGVLFEGDRLTNLSFIEHCLENYDTQIFYLEVSPETRAKRYAERGSNQDEKFLRGRETKYANILTNFNVMMNVVKAKHETPEDTLELADLIKGSFYGSTTISR